MAKFVPFNGKGLAYFNRVDNGHICNFCGKKMKTFQLYESHWPKCTGVCKERKLKPFPLPKYPHVRSSFK
ncbi:hypothetical protein COEREDRAFT_92465 [Coemansia reversa NRRL 1564]|uniref:Uncharacterized protein n=1 Tax=Coemansia reversa (strain ATCC 12441 / NRRL 1564) TaxID=763665 RepID=A0A2G5BBS2_COERN|nr:hypothetical protein COEREDRAFT_92465 [Coemansia reversa NRRL 1564]|eukprot:PIA16442.1 hypothetical protein COEREDRAFT_92465 [Coemansia reversa NRRL 1564]